MKHHGQTSKLGRETGVRLALLRSLANNLITYGRIETTEAKAKALRPFIERVVTIAKTDSLAAKRLVFKRLGSGAKANKLFQEIAPRYTDRPGGYTRIIKKAPRLGDGSRQAFIEFV